MSEDGLEAKVIPFPMQVEPGNLQCALCGGEWWKATVVFYDDTEITHIAGWRARVACDSCGAERALYDEG